MYDIVTKRITQYLQRHIIGNVYVKITRNDILTCNIKSDTGLFFSASIPNITHEIIYGTGLNHIEAYFLKEYRKYINSVHFL